MQTLGSVKKKILVVDDDELLRQLLANDFVRRGYDVTQAGDGAQALELLGRQKFDLVISDVKMPRLGGVELLTAIRRRPEEIPVFMFITGFSELTLEDAYHKGANALFSKPFNRKNFLKAVDGVLQPIPEPKHAPAPQLLTDFEVELTLKQSPQSVRGQMLNIGQGGMFVGMEAPLPGIGNTLDFKILFQQVSSIQVTGHGIVRWLQDQPISGRLAGCGIEILNFDDSDNPEAARLIETFKPLISET